MSQDAINEAKRLISLGKQAEAQHILESLLKSDPQNITAWLWYVETWQTKSQKIKVLEFCLRHNPGNELVKQALESVKSQQRETPSNINTQSPIRENRRVDKATTSSRPSSNRKRIPWLTYSIIAIGLTILFCGAIILLYVGIFSAPYRKSAKEYIPTQIEMPAGFSIDPSYSGPINVEYGNAYQISYVRLLPTYGRLSVVTFIVAVYPLSTFAEWKYVQVSQKGAGLIQVYNDPIPIISAGSASGVDEAMLYVHDSKPGQSTTWQVHIRKKNVVASIGMVGVIGSANPQESIAGFIREIGYYSSLLTNKFDQ